MRPSAYSVASSRPDIQLALGVLMRLDEMESSLHEELPTITFDERLNRVESEMLYRNAQTRLYGRSSLYFHNRNILTLVQAWRQPCGLQLAGALFGAYKSRDGLPPLFSRNERELVKDMIGEAAEELVFLSSGDELGDLVRLRTLQPDEVIADLAILGIADAAWSSKDDGAPSLWLQRASHYATFIQPARPSLPIFDACSALIGVADEAALLEAYELTLSASRDDRQDGALEAASRTSPWVAEPFVLLGLKALAAGDLQTAVENGDRAAALLRAWNCPWDKRLTAIEWLALSNLLQSSVSLEGPELSFLASVVSRTMRVYNGRPEILHAQLNAIDLLGNATFDPPPAPQREGSDLEDEWQGWSAFDLLPQRFSKYINGLRENEDSPSLPWYPDIDGRSIWDVLEFDIARELQSRMHDISIECLALDPALFSSVQRQRPAPHELRLYMLLSEGQLHQANCARVPALRDIIERYRTVRRIGPSAFIARLAPNCRTKPYSGSRNVLLRCQVNVGTSDRSGVTVEGHRETLRRGRCLIFTDLAMREEWNDEDNESIFLAVDLWHPDLTDEEVELLEGLLRYGRASR